MLYRQDGAGKQWQSPPRQVALFEIPAKGQVRHHATGNTKRPLSAGGHPLSHGSRSEV